MVNGEYPFYEMRQQKLESRWTAKPDKVYDSYGNEVVSMPDKVYDWQNKYVQDSTYRYTQPLGIELEQGKNTISIELSEGTLLLGDICLTAKPQVTEYAGSEAASRSRLRISSTGMTRQSMRPVSMIRTCIPIRQETG